MALNLYSIVNLRLCSQLSLSEQIFNNYKGIRPMIKSDKGIDRQKVREGSGKSGGEGREREGRAGRGRNH